MNIPEAVKITGGLTNTSKMPCYSYGIPAYTCGVGSYLRREFANGINQSVCSKCYAHKSRYSFQNVKDSYHRRYERVLEALGDKEIKGKWIEAMTYLINAYGSEYFRWHDSGDLLSLEHLEMIIEVVKATNRDGNHVNHWLPTLEFGVCDEYVKKHGKFDKIQNLVVRLSTPMIDGKPNEILAGQFGCQTSIVTRKNESFKAYNLLDKEVKEALENEKLYGLSVGETMRCLEVLKKKQTLRENEMSKNVCTSKMQDNSCMDCRKCWDSTQTNITYILH
jgi:hypothetical protein